MDYSSRKVCWNGLNEYYIETGFESDWNSGSLFIYDEDHEDSFATAWKYGALDDIGDDKHDGLAFASIDGCGGACANLELSEGDVSKDASVGIGFYIVGENAGGLQTGDVSSWEGLCVGYTSEVDLKIQLNLDGEKDIEIKGNRPFAILPKSEGDNVKCFAWSEFTDATSGDAVVKAEDLAKKLAFVKFGTTFNDAQKGGFNIKMISSISKK